MYTLLLATLAAAPGLAPPSPPHEDQNPIYKGLLDPGLAVGNDTHAKFPPPTMPDGLSAADQKAVIEKLIAREYSYSEFTRRSAVAPHLLKLRDVTPSDPNAPARGVDIWFILYGDLKLLNDEKFLERVLKAGRGEGKGDSLKPEELAKRKIAIGDDKHEGYAFLEFDFLEKVRLKATGRGFWSQTPESALVAGEIDPRFLNDPQYPNQWQSLDKSSGTLKVGPASPWSGAAFYFKITQLQQPAGALFFEKHVIFAEPMGWFNGANLLRSKLPIAVQRNVRNIRAEWTKGAGK